MNGRVVFLARAGDALAGARLVGVRSDDSWRARGEAETPDAALLRHDAQAAAAWIAERSAGGIAFLCVDVDGSNCSWKTTPGTDPAVIAAAIAQEEQAAGWSNPGPEGASIQALAVRPVAARKRRRVSASPELDGFGQRLAVLAVPDTLARLVIDDLDDRGVAVERAGSLWHALAMAWDPGSPVLASPVQNGDLVGGAAPVTGVVIVDPDGRLIWAWSRAGELLAGGVILTGHSASGAARVGKAEVGRLVADWLGWSVQAGTAPARVVCVAGELGEGTEEDMSPGQIGSAIGRAWPGVSVDMAVYDDPIGATLQRLAGSEVTPSEDSKSNLLALSRRPRRVHRMMYLWTALAVVLLAGGLLGLGVKAWSSAGAAREKAGTALDETRKIVMAAAPPLNDAVMMAKAEGDPARYLQERIDSIERERSVPTGLPQGRPILAELESLSYVLGIDGIELVEIRLSESGVDVQVYVPAVKIAEELKESLDRVSNEHCTWTIRFPQQKKENLQMIWLEGAWKERAGGVSSGGGT